MWKQNIIKYQKTDGESVAGGGKIKRDLHPVIATTTQNKLLQGAANKVFTDTGISLPGNMTVGIKGRTYNNGVAETKKPVEKSFNFGQVLSSDKAEKAYPTLGMAVDLGNQFIDRDLTKNSTGFDSQQQIGDMLIKSGNPYAAVAGLAYKALSGIAEATGGNTNTITKDQAANVGVNGWERIGNNVLGVIPGLGWIPGTGTSEGQKSHLVDEMSNAYADSVYDINQSQTLGGGKYLFGRDKIERSILESNHRNKQLSEINLTNTMRKKSDYAQDLAQQNLNRYMGTNYMDMRMGKQGMKFPELDSIRELLNNRVSETDIQKFADGGSILPVGSRHKNLNHLSEINPELGGLTRKGIPVVTLNEGGEIEQIAEIECNEWTLSKSLTDQIEALWKDGSEEAMIECGKIVCEELLRNTKDEGNILQLEKEEGEDGNN